ncbi:MAG: menaquinone biosynthesis protein [Proteobacteria bacterium]|nr:menaquinone biosynthesis protein [Pseudomonadota bacterium]MCG2742244.1 menaquinone biosynthesis protein [Syntrophaceae bacterium]
MNLGYIDYVNCYPFYYHMFEIEPLPGVRVAPGYPSALNSMMGKGTLDMSPISSAVYADLEREIVLLPDFCLSSVGYVHSVILSSNLPIEELHEKRVGLSSASQTSVVLLKILLRRYYAIEPVYVPTDPNPSLKGQGIDAALIIGNEAMMQEMAPYTYDLGDLWMRKTGYPVVFAVFAVRESFADRHFQTISAVVDSYRRSLACLDLDRETLIRKVRERYRSVRYDIDAYYRVLKYVFNPGLREALTFYLRSAGEMGLLNKVGAERFLNKGGSDPAGVSGG